jgi:NADH:ubiquinone oxidoreductase subunit 4 (subunit M)
MAVFFLKIVRRALAGKGERGRKDLLGCDLLVLLPPVLLVIWMGVRPGVLLRHLDRSTERFISRVTEARLLKD